MAQPQGREQQEEEWNPKRARPRAVDLETPLHRLLTIVEDMIYYAISAVLVVATAALLVSASIQWVGSLGVDLRAGTLTLLDNVLLVMMLVEILSTISISLRQHVLAPQQFLIIGLIAAVRRMLVITAEQTELLHEPETFQLLLWELLLLGVLVIVLSGAIYLLHKVPERSGVDKVPERSGVDKVPERSGVDKGPERSGQGAE